MADIFVEVECALTVGGIPLRPGQVLDLGVVPLSRCPEIDAR
jgi:hypothetical protein